MAGLAPASGLIARLGWNHRGFRVANRPAATLGLILLLALPFVADQIAFQQRMARHNPDLKGWLDNAATLLHDPARPFYPENPFYIYPPFFLTLIAPLTHLPMPVAAAIFETAKWIALFFSLRLAWRLAAPQGEDVPPIVALATLLCTWRFIDNDLGQGNVNLLLLWVMLSSTWLVLRGRDTLGGAVLALAVCVKVTPALLLVYFVYKGRWRVLLGTAMAMVICLWLWPACIFGWENNLRLLGEWYHAVVAGFVASGATRSEHANQSLVALVARLLGPDPAFTHPDRYLSLVVLPQWARAVLRYALAAGILAALAWLCRPRRPRPDPHRTWPAEIGVVLIAMLLLSGLSWKAHYVTLLLPYALLLAFAVDARHAVRQRWTAGIWAVISFALGTLTSDLITPRGADYAEVYGCVALAGVSAAIGLWQVCRSRARISSEPRP